MSVVELSFADRLLLEAQAGAARHGKFWGSNKAGRLFLATSATAGIAIIVAATTGGHPTLLNPVGSGRVLNVRRLLVAYVSGANAPGGLAWNSTTFGAQPATGASHNVLTATKVAVLNAKVGGPVDSRAWFSPTTNTFTAAPTYYRPIGLSLFTGVDATAVAPFTLGEEYDGDLQIEPGNGICLVTSQATTTALLRYTILFEEIDE